MGDGRQRWEIEVGIKSSYTPANFLMFPRNATLSVANLRYKFYICIWKKPERKFATTSVGGRGAILNSHKINPIAQSSDKKCGITRRLSHFNQIFRKFFSNFGTRVN